MPNAKKQHPLTLSVKGTATNNDKTEEIRFFANQIYDRHPVLLRDIDPIIVAHLLRDLLIHEQITPDAFPDYVIGLKNHHETLCRNNLMRMPLSAYLQENQIARNQSNKPTTIGAQTQPSSNPQFKPNNPYSVELITPEMAQQYLALNYKNNRALNESRVVQYMRDMLEGRWKFNGDLIRFNKDGFLIDGQHRLTAVVRSGFCLLTGVVRELGNDVMQTLDLNQVRTPGQMAKIEGMPNGNLLTAVARLVLIYDKFDKSFGGNSLSQGPTKNEVLDYSRENLQVLMPSVVIGAGLAKLTAGSIAGACHFIFTRINSASAKRFFEELAEGGAPKDSAVFLLRERLLVNKSNLTGKYVRRYLLALFFKAYKHYLADRKVHILSWRQDGATPEGFPEL